jgi:hypothetical protein
MGSPGTEGIDRPTTKQPAEKTGHLDIPAQVGPVRFGRFCGWVTVRCPFEYAQLIQAAGGMWDPGARQWCVHPGRIGQVLRELLRLRHSYSSD